MRDLFRKEALENFSSKDNACIGVRAVSIKTSIFVVLLLICASVFAVWLVFGRVYETVSVSGIIWSAKNNGAVYSKCGGIISKTMVSSGEAVKTGDILALVPQEDILRKIKDKKSENVSDEQLSELYDEYDKCSVIRSNIDGIVTQIADENSYISAGEKVAEIVPYDESGNNKTLTAFIPSAKGELIKLGMEVQVMPDFMSREENGYIKAYISGISGYPIMGQTIKENRKELFVAGLDEKESYLQLEITLIPDASAQSHLKWSNPKSGDIDVKLGTICTADIIIRNCHPYEWLF